MRIYRDDAGGATHGFCSGTMVTRGIVLTAAHCLYANPTDGNGKIGFYDTNLMRVVPGNHSLAGDGNDAAPYGIWRPVRSYVTTGWQQNDGGLDWGVLVLGPDSSGRYAGDYTGSFTAQWNASFSAGERLYKVGYPSSGPFNTGAYDFGGGQFFCDMTWEGAQYQPDAYWGQSFALITSPCAMNGGSSGGPVFAYFGDIAQWAIVGVNNRGRDRADGFGDYGISFYLDSRFGEFWNGVVAALG